jgi:hypothetical protein
VSVLAPDVKPTHASEEMHADFLRKLRQARAAGG